MSRHVFWKICVLLGFFTVLPTLFLACNPRTPGSECKEWDKGEEHRYGLIVTGEDSRTVFDVTTEFIKDVRGNFRNFKTSDGRLVTGSLITHIGGIEEDWEFFVRKKGEKKFIQPIGESVSADNYIVEKGDEIIWRVCVDW